MKIGWDFDGVLAEHQSHYAENQVGEPLKPGLAFLKACIESGHDCLIITARKKYHRSIQGWIRQQIGYDLAVTNIKEPCDFYLDDKSNFPRNLK